VIGRLQVSGNGQVLGSLDGDIVCPGELTVGPEAEVRADIEAGSLVVSGSVKGNVRVRGRLKITTTGRVEGDAHVGSLVVHEGAVHRGLLQVYPDGLPELPSTTITVPARVVSVPAVSPITASVERVKKMWSEIF
jgi:cytoskeletal protein CcmA (bactofilin family)